jgi:hypothetical protein
VNRARTESVDEWRAYRDISDELPVFCPECAERELSQETPWGREAATTAGAWIANYSVLAPVHVRDVRRGIPDTSDPRNHAL